MRIDVSIPDDVFDDAERLAQELQTSRSQLYARALAEFIVRHSSDHVTELMNQSLHEITPQDDRFLKRANQEILENNEW